MSKVVREKKKKTQEIAWICVKNRFGNLNFVILNRYSLCQNLLRIIYMTNGSNFKFMLIIHRYMYFNVLRKKKKFSLSISIYAYKFGELSF